MHVRHGCDVFSQVADGSHKSGLQRSKRWPQAVPVAEPQHAGAAAQAQPVPGSVAFGRVSIAIAARK
eukprot:2687436-Prymnesium_polylepis.5